MQRVEERFKDDGLKVIWMGFQDGKEQIMNFMTKYDIESSVAYDDRNLISSQYGIAYGAGLIVINKEGIVTKRIPKGFSEDELVKGIADAISPASAAAK
ncbi:MAG: redoxin domain-containing protein [Nitrospirae bacterium]|nr:redoxin domain-containing protein [Nitrospirota bacterium]